MANLDVEDWLGANSVEFVTVGSEQRGRILNQWNETSSSNVKEQTGSWIHNRFRWHSFSYGFHQAMEGEAALVTYLEQWRANFVVFDESGNWCVTCKSAGYPDLSPLKRDLYVAHHNMKWTMAFTHEQPEIGPFFATRQSS